MTHTSPRNFPPVDRLESLRDHGQHDAARDPDEDEEEEDRADEPPVVRERLKA